MVKLLSFLKPYKKSAFLGPLFKFIESVSELTIPIFMAMLIDRGVKANDLQAVFVFSTIILVLALAGFVIAVLGQYFSTRASQGFGTELRQGVFHKIANMSYAELDRTGAVSLTNRVIFDINQVQLAVFMVLRVAIRAPFLCIGSAIAAMIIDVQLASVIIISIPVLAMVIFALIGLSVRMYAKVQERLDNMSVAASENLTGVRVIRAFAKTGYERERFAQASDSHAASAVKAGRVGALSGPVTGMMINGAILLIIFMGGGQVNAGNMTQGEIVAFISYMSQILLALMVLTNMVIIFTKALSSAKRLRQILDSESGMTDGEKEQVDGSDVRMDNVTFSYGGERAVLKNINLEIKSGSTYGIVGLTGSGKTALINLIMRFYDPDSGTVSIGGTDVREYKTAALRRSAVIVQQRAVLFEGTVKDNLAMGNPSVTDEDIVRALKAAQADFVLGYDDGVMHKVVRGGKNFSGGQRQRLSIARALAARPSVLILDDSTSALDYRTESALLRSLARFDKTMTVIIVSQRVGSLRSCSRIAVMADGEITNIGNHETLMAESELYRTIFGAQPEEYKSAAAKGGRR